MPQGRPLICDFGEARFSDQEYNDDIMPDIYRAPEVIMHMNWNNKVDIWSVAMVVSTMLVGTLFLPWKMINSYIGLGPRRSADSLPSPEPRDE